ncbi:hypothetical protein D3C75_1344690 [compost metagenome]
MCRLLLSAKARGVDRKIRLAQRALVAEPPAQRVMLRICHASSRVNALLLRREAVSPASI